MCGQVALLPHFLAHLTIHFLATLTRIPLTELLRRSLLGGDPSEIRQQEIPRQTRKRRMKKLLIMLVLLGVILCVTSCNMLKGAGKDIENAGEAVQDAAK